MTTFQLVSGEAARVEIIPRSQAISILSKPTPQRTWFGEKYRSAHRTSRGPGGAADYLNVGLIVTYKGKDTYRAVMRFGTAPWRNKPVIAAVGPDLEKFTVYLSRLWGSGI